MVEESSTRGGSEFGICRTPTESRLVSFCQSRTVLEGALVSKAAICVNRESAGGDGLTASIPSTRVEQ